MSSVPFDPYHKWLGIPRSEQPANHYRLLGIPQFEDDVQVIEAAADRHMSFLRKFQSGEHGADATRVLNEVSRARLCLLKPAAKQAYDAELKQSLPRARDSRRSPQWVLPATIAGAICVLGVVVAVAVFNRMGSPNAAQTTVPANWTAAEKRPVAGGQVVPLEQSGDTKRNVQLTGKQLTPEQPVRAATKKANGGKSSPSDVVNAAVPEADPVKSAQPQEVATKPTTVAANIPATDAANSPGPDTSTTVLRQESSLEENPSEEDVSQTKLITPDEVTQAVALKQVQEIFKVEYARARKADGRNLKPRISLARALYAHAEAPVTDPAASFVSYVQAAEWASEAGQLDLAWKILEGLGVRFDTTPLPLMQKAVKAAKPFAKSLEELVALTAIYVQLIDAAVDEDDFEIAIKAAQEAASVSRRIPELKEQVVIHTRRVTQLREAFELSRAAKLKTETIPDDPIANLTWGSYLCFCKGDWAKGLPLLAASDDAELASLAKRDLERTPNVDDLTHLGDDWWEVASRESAPQRAIIRDHALDAWQAALTVSEQDGKQTLIEKIARSFESTKTFVTSGLGMGLAVAEPQFDPGPRFTFEFWVTTTAPNGVLISKRHQTEDSSIVLSLRGGRVAVGRDSRKHYEKFVSRAVINDGRWHHVAVVRVRNVLGLFVDGKAIGNCESTEQYSSRSPWKVGHQDSGTLPEIPARFCRVRLSKEARYLVNFDPEKTYSNDRITLLMPK